MESSECVAMHGVQHEYLSESEYLAQEERASVKHEYVDGQVHAMAGRRSGTTGSPSTWLSRGAAIPGAG